MSHALHLGDCLEGMAMLADKSVDHVICDPPYSERVHTLSRRNNSVNGRPAAPVAVAFGFDHIGNDDVLTIAEQLGRATRRWAVVFCAAEHISAWSVGLAATGMEIARVGVWVKKAPAPQFAGDRPASGVEFLIVAHAPGRKRWNAGGKAGVWYGDVIGKDHGRLHPAQKPLDLMEQLVRDFTDPGELICDPFAGSGTTGVACKRLGRNFIGWEKDPKFHAAAVKRIEAAREQFQLPRLPKAKQTGMVLHAPGAEAVDAQTKAQPVDP